MDRLIMMLCVLEVNSHVLMTARVVSFSQAVTAAVRMTRYFNVEVTGI